MRDRSDAMHITSESTRGRHRGIWLVARAVSAVPQQCRSSAAAVPQLATPSLLVPAPGTQAISGTGARCAIGEAAYLLGAWEAGELALGPTHSLARSHLSGYHGSNSAHSRLFTLGRLLSRRLLW